MITLLIVILTVAVSLYAFKRQELLYRFDLSPYHIVHKRQYYRIFTHALLHADYVHLAINMLVLYSFGSFVEQKFEDMEAQGELFSGAFFFIFLYVASIALASLTTISRYRNNEQYSALGASGAVSAVVFTYILFAPLQKIYFYMILPIPGFLFGILYLVYSSYMGKRNKDNINHSAHFWGAVVGFVLPILVEPLLFIEFIENFIPK